MAAFDLLTLQNGKPKRQPSASTTLDLLAIRIGASTLTIAESAGHFDFSAKRLTNVAAPSAGTDAANKDYVDSVAGGYDPKDSVDLATAAALSACTYANGTGGVGATLTADANGALTVDGVLTTVGLRILVKNQVAGLQNGVYTVTAVGDGSNPFVLTRALDFDNSPSGEVTKGARMLVTGGTVTGWSYYLTTSGAVTIGTTALSFSVADSTPTATSASGGGTQGKLSADSDKGLLITAGVLEVTMDGQGLQFTGGQLALELDGGTLSKSASGVKVADAGITGTQLAASVAGAGLTGGAGSALAVGAGDGIKVAANDVAVDYAESKANDNAGAITVNQLVYVKSNGNVDLAKADNAAFGLGTRFGLVEDASIPASNTGKIVLRTGKKCGGFTGLTIGAPVYVSRATAGAYQQDLSGFVAGEHVVAIGDAISATEVIYQPRYVLEY